MNNERKLLAESPISTFQAMNKTARCFRCADEIGMRLSSTGKSKEVRIGIDTGRVE